MNRVIVVSIIALVLPWSASALARAQFPSASRLQPPPVNVHANTSGNVNSTLAPAEYISPEAVQEIQGTNNNVAHVPAATQNEPAQSGGGLNYMLWGIFGVIILGAMVFLFVRSRQSGDSIER